MSINRWRALAAAGIAVALLGFACIPGAFVVAIFDLQIGTGLALGGLMSVAGGVVLAELCLRHVQHLRRGRWF